MDRTITQIMNKEIENLNNTTDQVDLTDIQIIYPTKGGYTFFSKYTWDIF